MIVRSAFAVLASVVMTVPPAAAQENTLDFYGSGGIGLANESGLVLGLGVPLWRSGGWSVAVDGDAFVWNREGYLAAGLDLRTPAFAKDRLYAVAGGKVSTEGPVMTGGLGFLRRGEADLALELLIHGWENAFGGFGLVLRKAFDW